MPLEGLTHASLQIEADKFSNELGTYLSRFDLTDLVRPPLDHCAIKATDSRQYETWLNTCQQLCTQSSYVHIDNRRIATVALVDPLVFGELGETTLLEIMEPKPEKAGNGFVGLEHIEVWHASLDDVITFLRRRDVPFVDSGNLYHRTVVIRLNAAGQELKFTDRPLLQVLELEHKSGVNIAQIKI